MTSPDGPSAPRRKFANPPREYTQSLRLRLNPEEFAKLSGDADAAQLSISTYVRRTAINGRSTPRAKKYPRSHGKLAAFNLGQLGMIASNFRQILRAAPLPLMQREEIEQALEHIQECASIIRSIIRSRLRP